MLSALVATGLAAVATADIEEISVSLSAGPYPPPKPAIASDVADLAALVALLATAGIEKVTVPLSGGPRPSSQKREKGSEKKPLAKVAAKRKQSRTSEDPPEGTEAGNVTSLNILSLNISSSGSLKSCESWRTVASPRPTKRAVLEPGPSTSS
jgi:hypothetical protein